MRALCTGLTALALLAGLAGCGDVGGIGPGGSHPNVLVILTDDQDTGLVQYMPNVQRLIADRGVIFENSIVSNPLCCPSRATLLTGQYSHNNNVYSNHRGFQKLDLEETLGVWLQNAGYHTAYVGKYLNGYPGPDRKPVPPPGWDDFTTPTRHVTDMQHYKLARNGHERSFGTSDKKYKTTILGSMAMKALRGALDKPDPFFMVFAPTAPHAELTVDGCPDPRLPPGTKRLMRDLRAPRTRAWDEANVTDKPRYVKAFPRLSAARRALMDCQHRSRALSVTAVDYWVGRLLDRIEIAGEAGETLVMFMSDNGYVRGQHRIPSGKVIPYEESIRVPLMMRGPSIPAGAVRDQLVANVDWAPTILDAAGVSAEHELDGISLLELAREPRAGRGRDILLQASDFEPFPGNRSPAYEGVRAQRWTYVEYKTGERELYDLAADPAQLRNLDHSKKHGPTRKRLAAALDRLRTCAGSSCREGLLPAGGGTSTAP